MSKKSLEIYLRAALKGSKKLCVKGDFQPTVGVVSICHVVQKPHYIPVSILKLNFIQSYTPTTVASVQVIVSIEYHCLDYLLQNCSS